MCQNFSTPYRARRAAAKFRKRYDAVRTYQYVLTEGRMYATGLLVWHVAVFSKAHVFLTYV